MDVSAGTLSSVAKQYYGNTWRASGSVRAWTWCHENVALEENNLDHIGCDHTSTKAPDPIRTPELSVLEIGRASCRERAGMSSVAISLNEEFFYCLGYLDALFIDYLLHAMDVSAGTLSSVANQYYGDAWSASEIVRAWTWSREIFALEENNLDHIGCDHTSTKAPDPIRTPELSVL